MQKLEGGREGIYKNGNWVTRPLHKSSATIHHLLNHLHKNGFTQCPEFIAIEGDNEILTFIEGDTFDYPLEGAIGSETALISAAKLLRKLHDSSESFLQNHENLTWLLPVREPQEVICHGDFTPYNVALKGNEVVGIFDFDVSHPAPRIWDLAFSVYCWSPFMTDPGCVKGTIEEQIQRANIFLEAYGASKKNREKLVATMILRIEAIVAYMKSEADNGNLKFQQDIEDGNLTWYLKDIEYLKNNAELITSGLVG